MILLSVVFLVVGFAVFYWSTVRLGGRSPSAVRTAGIGGAGIFIAGFAASVTLYAAPAAVPVVAVASPPQDIQIGPDSAVIERLPRLNGSAAGFIDEVFVRKSTVAPFEPADLSDVPVTSRLEVRGWACNSHFLPGTAMFVIADGARRLDLPRAYGLDRRDVARALANPSLQNVGYVFDVPAHTFKPGRHELQIALVSVDGAGFYTLPKPLWLTFTSR